MQSTAKNTQIKTYTQKTLWIILISLASLIPLMMLDFLLNERSQTAENVKEQIGSDWGRQNSFYAPIIVVPGGKENPITVMEPNNISLSINLQAQERKKGIYKNIVYTSEVAFRAEYAFDKDDILSQQYIQTAFIDLGDTKILNTKNMLIDGIPLDKASLRKVLSKQDKHINFTISGTILLKGNSHFYIQPNATHSTISLHSNWNAPSFSGVLPDSYTIDSNGFNAEYQIEQSNRNPLRLSSLYGYNEFLDQNAIIGLYEGVSEYRLIERTIKYGFLFVALTLLVLLLCEISNKANMILLQYMIVGVSLVIFYLELLAFSEQIGFVLTYILSSISIVLPISLYTYSIMRQKRFAFIIFGATSSLYICLFIMLFQDEYALIIGTIIAMIAIYLAMYYTRNLNKTQKYDETYIASQPNAQKESKS